MANKYVEEFKREYINTCHPYLYIGDPVGKRVTTEAMLDNILEETYTLLESKENKDKTLEEKIDLIIEKNIIQCEDYRKYCGMPGYSASILVNGMDINFYGGQIKTNGDLLPENAIFDIASMTKFYTMIIAYKLINSGLLKRSDRIIDLDSRFVNLGEVTVNDILTFSVKFQTMDINKEKNESIKDKETTEEALDTLYRTSVVKIGEYNYNDIGLMIMSKVMKKLTGKTYSELFDEYIVNPYNLKNTHVIVPKEKRHLITGSSNAEYGLSTDITAASVAEYNEKTDEYAACSGSAGCFTTSRESLDFMNKVTNVNPVKGIEDAYTPNKLKDYRGHMGPTFVNHYDGVDLTFLDSLDPWKSYCISGSSRTNATISKNSGHSIFFNPASMDEEEVRRQMPRIKEDLAKKGKTTSFEQTVVKFPKIKCGKKITLTLIDPRNILEVSYMENASRLMAETVVRLMFLDYLTRQVEKENEIEYTRHVVR